MTDRQTPVGADTGTQPEDPRQTFLAVQQARRPRLKKLIGLALMLFFMYWFFVPERGYWNSHAQDLIEWFGGADSEEIWLFILSMLTYVVGWRYRLLLGTLVLLPLDLLLQRLGRVLR